MKSTVIVSQIKLRRDRSRREHGKADNDTDTARTAQRHTCSWLAGRTCLTAVDLHQLSGGGGQMQR